MGVSKHPEEPKGRGRRSGWSGGVGAFFCHRVPLINRTGNVYHLLLPHRSLTLTFLDTVGGGGKERLCASPHT